MPMPPIVFQIKLFETPDDRARSQKALLWLMESLVNVNVGWLRKHPQAPSIYKAGVKYLAEVEGQEHWQDIPTMLQTKNGDCEDLSSWRCAELRLAGIAAHPFIKWRKVNGSLRYHALVAHPDGSIEDPSLALGMRKGYEPHTPQIIGYWR